MRGIKRRLRIEGLNAERFLNRASAAGVTLERIRRQGKRLRCVVREEDLPHVQEIAMQGGWSCTIGNRTGAGRALNAARQHRGLMATSIVCIIMLLLALQFVWHVEITGEAIYCAEAQRFLANEGFRPFMLKRKVDLAALRDMLEWRYPEVAWVDCGWRGTTLRIELVQGIVPGETITTQGGGDVVASRNGVIESVITLAGTAVIKPGDVVQKGQVLIIGQERGAGETVRPVMARGKVLARVWDQAGVRMSMNEEVTR